MAFDPSQFGATEASNSASSGGFDPSKFGATAVQSQPTVAPTQQTSNFTSAGTTVRPQGTSLSDQIWNDLAGATSAFGAATGANAIGQELGKTAQNIGKLAQGQNPDIPVNVPRLAGGIMQAGATVASAGLPIAEAPTAIARIGQAAAGYGSLGAVAGAGNALENNKGAGGVLKSSALGGALGATGGIAGQGAGEAIGALRSPTAQGIKTYAQSQGEVNAVQDLISPKLTSKELKLALDQGRIVPGQDATLLKDGTPDTVLPSAKTQKAAITVADTIPDAHNLDPQSLYNAIDSKVSDVATKLKPEMQKVPVNDAVLGKINDAWQALKEKQLADPYISSEVDLDKFHAQFEKKFLDPIVNKNFNAGMDAQINVEPKVPTMDDMWEQAKAYDNSVPDRVKSASAISDDKLQTQKSIWLQNRAILRDAINDASTGLGEKSQTAFSQMSDLYNAQKGIQSKVKLNTEPEESGLKRALKSPLGRGLKTVAKYGALGGVIGEGAKHL